MIRIAIPALTAMITVAAFVGAAGWNRSGEPRLTMTLTERELRLIDGPPDAVTGDIGSIELQIVVQHRAEPLDARNWLPDARLRALGFNLDIPAGSPNAPAKYDNPPPRLGWVALEYDGPAWRAIERRLSLLETPDAGRLAQASRLVPVDAAGTFEALHQRYPEGHLILPAVFQLNYVNAAGTGPILYGSLREVIPRTLTVTSDQRAVFLGLPADARQPRYEVDLSLGQLGLPFVQAARRLP